MISKSLKATVLASAGAIFLAGFFQTGCDCGTTSSEFGGGGTDGAVDEGGPLPPPLGGDGGDGSSTQGTLAVTPSTAQVAVTIVNGAVTANAPVTFAATLDGQPATGVAWSVDRGELGSISAAGVFTASGAGVGDGTITATLGNRQASAKLTVTVQSKQNGGTGAGADAGAGGVGGVGGEVLGGAVDPAIVARLEAEANADPTLKYLYPYANTVFPRGILAPLVMWDTTSTASAIYITLTQKNFTFEGTYDVSARTGDATRRVHIDDAAWIAATNGNGGDPLTITVKIYDAGANKVFGPVTQPLKIAPGILKGTVYYNSYDSHLTGQAPGVNRALGGVIAIQPRSPNPQLAVANMSGKCHVCHSLSSDGSTLFAEDGEADFAHPSFDGSGDYRNGASYDLKNGGARTMVQSVLLDGGVANAANDRKFVWAAPYADGSFLLTSYGYARETYLGDQTLAGPSQLVKKDGTVAASNINTMITSAVTPAFSPDGRKVVFNFWGGAGAGGVLPGAGHSLAILDFSCGAAAGAVACGAASPYAFSNLREIYHPAVTADGGPFVGWPSFTPDGKSVLFHQSYNTNPALNPPIAPTTPGGPGNPTPGRFNDQLTSWFQRDAELYIARDDATKTGIRLDALNGKDGAGAPYLPTSATHPDDTVLNYMPTVNPVASGGFYWVVFESRRKYGNVLDLDPWTLAAACPPPDQLTSPCPYGSKQKKLWVAAIDTATGAIDPSHPPFYLPGQELDAGNSRGYWVVDPCKGDGSSCATGDECCGGFCRAAGDGGALICGKPTGPTCAQEFEKCTVDADCCNAPTDLCIGNRCSQRGVK